MARAIRVLAVILALLASAAGTSWSQQLTTATLTGSVKDAQGLPLPGVSIELTSETRGLAVPTVATDERGEFLVTNLAPDTYTLVATLEGFGPLRRRGIPLSGGDRSTTGELTLEVGGLAETVTVEAETNFVQAESGERSFTVAPKTVESLPIANRSFTSLVSLAPGVTQDPLRPTRIGGGGNPNIMMDGISTMDPGGNNRASLGMNVESIAEIKVVTSSYQAEYGRSSGIQVLAVTKGGTNQFHGSLYDVERRSSWNSNSKTNILNGDPKPYVNERDWGYSIGGPIGKPGGANKLFFFYAQEYAPRSRSGIVSRFRVPTALERAGNFSQSIDNNGSVYNLIRDASTGLPCTATNTAGCFQDGGVLGKIPAERLYAPGVNVLKLWPLPNVNVPGASYNYEVTSPEDKQKATQPAVKVEYQALDNLRLGFKYSAWMQSERPVLGTLPGFNDTIMSHPVVATWALNGNYSFNGTTFLEVTGGRLSQELVGCAGATSGSAPVYCQGAIAANDIASPLNSGLASFPMLFPDAGVLPSDTHMAWLLTNISSPLYQNGRVSILPTYAWGSRIANAPPNVSMPSGGGMNQVKSENLTAALTKVWGQHAIKTGFYFDHTVKTQTAAAGTASAGAYRGAVSFANDTNNPLDSTFGFANSALGVYTSFQQTSKIAEGINGFKNIEAYVQDTWRRNKLTLDYGLRFVHQSPQYDEANQTSNFLSDRWQASAAPLLYAPACANGVYPCSGNNRQARNPVTGALLGAGSAWRIGTIVPGTGDLLNGMVYGGEDGIPARGITSPLMQLGPRFGVAYDVTGKQKFVLRGGAGLFFARGFLNATASNPPFVEDSTLRYSTLQDLASQTLPVIPRQLAANQYDMPYAKDVQWSGGVQMMLPYSTSLDVAYAGHHSWDEPWANVDLAAVDYGTAYLPEYQDPTLTPSTTPGATAVTVAAMSPYRGFSGIQTVLSPGWRTFHSIQFSVNRRFSNGVQFGFNDTISLYDKGNTVSVAIPIRFQHAADGTPTIRPDQAEQDKLLEDMGTPRHTMRGSFVWDLPDLQSTGTSGRILRAIVNDWQLSGMWTAVTSTPYIIGYSYASGGTNTNLTGSPTYPARIRIIDDPGAGCGSDPLRQFNTAAFAGPLPGSVGLESGNNYLRGCFQSALDLAINRTIRIAGSKNVQVRLEVYNVPNQAIVTSRVTRIDMASPATSTVATNLPFDASGNPIPSRTIPKGAGFGVANGYQAARSMQVLIRFAF